MQRKSGCLIINETNEQQKLPRRGKTSRQEGRRLEHSQTSNTGNSHDVRHTKDNGSAQDCRHKETI